MNQLTLNECSKRKLDETYLVIYAIKNEINIKKGDYIEVLNSSCVAMVVRQQLNEKNRIIAKTGNLLYNRLCNQELQKY